jgi:hypothetical protein
MWMTDKQNAASPYFKTNEVVVPVGKERRVGAVEGLKSLLTAPLRGAKVFKKEG